MSELTLPREQRELADALLRAPGRSASTSLATWTRPSVRLTLLFLTLTCAGLIMSASAAGTAGFVSGTLKRFALTCAGLTLFAFGASVNYQWWRRHCWLGLGLALAGLVAVLVPGVGVQINGARRWINPGLPCGFQPSEFAKPALCIWLAAYCERNAGRMASFAHGFLAPSVIIGAVSLLVVVEPDLGTAVLAGTVGMTVLIVFGTRLVYVLLALAAAMPFLQKLIIDVPWRLQRVVAFIDPWRDPRGSGYQLIQSKIAIGSGSLFGVGLGAGHQKAGFLPGAENDFIFSVVAEELGFIGCLVVVALFLFMLWEALKVVLHSRDPFGFGLALGLATLLGLQAVVHVAVVTGSVPTKGLSLPFISAGGSSLLASMLAAGILVNIARAEERPEAWPLKPWQDDLPAYERVIRALLRPHAKRCAEAAQRMTG